MTYGCHPWKICVVKFDQSHCGIYFSNILACKVHASKVHFTVTIDSEKKLHSNKFGYGTELSY
jgi:hypothetical protein